MKEETQEKSQMDGKLPVDTIPQLGVGAGMEGKSGMSRTWCLNFNFSYTIHTTSQGLPPFYKFLLHSKTACCPKHGGCL